MANPARRGSEKEALDGWVMVKSLGTGGFGQVNLWKHEETAQVLALKNCRAISEMKQKHKERWQIECQIMVKLNHPNVVKALSVPDVLRERPGEPPVLAMEFCSEGDLRKVINLPENCCGLPESQIRNIARDISSAIEYLHNCHIIHRDLKPENIVLQKADEKVVYKLIDLGYAKDLDESSLCISFVGTMQYLAPELFAETRYNHTVDYWSFGTTLFECITGFRPFLHSMPPIKWQSYVCHKKNEHIHAYMGAGNKPNFSEKIPKPNNLCRITQPFFEQYLRLILRWNPQERGGELYSDQRPECFHKFEENVVNKKVIHIFCVPYNTELTYPVTNELIQDIQSLISREINIPVAQQELLDYTGVSVKPNEEAVKFTANIGEEDMALFLFCKNDMTFPEDKRKMRDVPQQVAFMLQQPKTLMMYEEKKKSWSQAVFYMQSISSDFQKLVDAQRATNVYLMRCKTKFVNSRHQMTSIKEDLRSKINFFNHCFEIDVKYLEKQKTAGVYSSSMHSSWVSKHSSIMALESLVDDAAALDRNCNAFDVRVIELQRSPFAKSKQVDRMQQICKQSADLFMDMRKMSQEFKRKASDNEKMIHLITACINEWDTLSRDIYLHLGKIQECRKELEKLEPRVSEINRKMDEASERILSFQLSRQKDVWTLVRKAFRSKSQTPSSTPSGNDNGPQSGLTSQPSSGFDYTDQQLQQPLSASYETQPSGGTSVTLRQASRRDMPASLQIIQQSSHASNLLRNECSYTKHQLETVIRDSLQNGGETMKSLSSNLDWSFLDDAKTSLH